jgi:hypothetical protein
MLSCAVPIATAGEGQRSHSEREALHQTRRPMSQPAAHPGPAANVQNDDEVTDADAVNDQAVGAYRLSVEAGNPLSERKLASMFGRTSRRWARTRIAQARRRQQAVADDSLPMPTASVAAMSRPSVHLAGAGTGTLRRAESSITTDPPGVGTGVNRTSLRGCLTASPLCFAQAPCHHAR